MRRTGIWLTFIFMGVLAAPAIAQDLEVRNRNGMRMLVVAENASPLLRVVLPGAATSDRAIEIYFPDLVTAVRHGSKADERLYKSKNGGGGQRPTWRRHGNMLEYERDLPGSVHLLAQATLESDGVRLLYEFSNHGNVSYDAITAVSDPRMTGIFHDERLERTFVHHEDGFDLLASEMPERLTMPREKWLPARCAASYTWQLPERRAARGADGIMYYSKSRKVDEPFIATRSRDGKWIVASFARETGDVWSNPAMTCQHVDPQMPLGQDDRAAREIKILVLDTSLEVALERARNQRSSLK